MTRRLSGKAARSSALWALSFASVLVCGKRAVAHDPPSGTGVYTRGAQLVVRTPRGLVVSRDAERRDFRFVCNEALGVAEFDAPSVLLQEDGSMLVGTSAGLVHVSQDLCEIDAMPAFGGARVSALARSSNASAAIYAATDAGFFVSSDRAQTFSAEDPSVFDSLELAADGVVYATGRLAGPRALPRVYFARWHQGAPLDRNELALEPTEVGAALLGSDPRDAQRVFAVAHAYLGTQSLDRFLVSSDGARSFMSPFAAASIGAFAFDGQSNTWLAGALDGLWRGTADQAPQRIRDAAVSCLSLQPSQLYVCDGIGAEGGLSLSADGGESWTSVFRFDQVSGLSDCPADVAAVQQCQTAWADWTLEMPPGPALAGIEVAADPDAGASPSEHSLLSTQNSSSGCDALGGIQSNNNHAQLWFWLSLAAALRRCRPHPFANQSKQT